MPHKVFQTIEEVSKYLHVAPERVRDLVRRGEIPHDKVGGRTTFRRKDIDSWASQRILGMEADELNDFHRRSAPREHTLARDRSILPELMTAACIEPSLPARTKASLIREMVAMADRTGLLNNVRDLQDSLETRERLCSTALNGGLAMLHPQHHDPYLFEDSFVLFSRTVQPIPFGSPDGQTTNLFFLLAMQDDRIHLHVLARLCLICYRTDLLMRLRELTDAQAILEAILAAEQEVVAGM